jgi:hypothetical protein
MRDDDGPGPLTPASASGAAICRRISGAGHRMGEPPRTRGVLTAAPNEGGESRYAGSEPVRHNGLPTAMLPDG